MVIDDPSLIERMSHEALTNGIARDAHEAHGDRGHRSGRTAHCQR